MRIHPLRKGYNKPATEEVLQAVRNVIADWDGLNWVAVRHCIETTMPNATGLDDWTIDDIRQRFAIGQRKMTIELGGRVNTTDATIVPLRFATIDVEENSDNQKAIQWWNDGDSWPTINAKMGRSGDQAKATEMELRRFAEKNGIEIRKGKPGAKKRR
jgi:hypothetical protein